ncbi:MAG TPA: cyclopropane fatty acyl phospholipid synthase [Terriglobales bacterium]|nr:cyclopropane fatty acyl phospholipid synthase [Terriglobales bacterium]
MSANLEIRARDLLATAGIAVGGSQPWDLSVHNPRLYWRVFRLGSLGLGESYMDGWWDCPRLDLFFERLFAAGLDRLGTRCWPALLLSVRARLFNPQSTRRAPIVSRRHYDIGNDLFAAMLGPQMVYTTGLWEAARNLEEAEVAKLNAVCQKLALEPGMRVLDIGCGWGSFARFAASRYNVQVDGITLSRAQLALGQELCGTLPVQLHLQDYREAPRALAACYDRIVSLGMFEHVGARNYRRFFATARRCLAAAGKMYLSTIGSNRSVRSTDPWIERYIFPNSHLPSIQQLGTAMEGHFTPLEWLNWAGDYDRTLMAWHENFSAGWDKWSREYGERFCRMWRFYLLSSAAAFRTRRLQVWQMLLEPLPS